MSDDPKAKEAVDQNNPAEGQAQLSEEALNQAAQKQINANSNDVNENHPVVQNTIPFNENYVNNGTAEVIEGNKEAHAEVAAENHTPDSHTTGETANELIKNS